MIKTIKEFVDFSLYLSSIDDEQVFIVATVLKSGTDQFEICKQVYDQIALLLAEDKISIFHERIFGSLDIYDYIKEIRNNVFNEYSIDSECPFTLIEGAPYWGYGLAGVNIHGIKLKNDTDSIENVSYENSIIGRLWRSKNAQHIMLNSIHGKNSKVEDSYTQTLNMFENANKILRDNSFEFKNVIRTWIYLHDILSQYSDFNKARNLKFKEFKLIPNEIDDNYVEDVYMPASTGICGNNPFHSAGIMDVYACKKDNSSSTIIRNESGIKQKAAYRYGSAFSRAMVVENPESKYIYLSGTASIDTSGNTVYIGDIGKQLEMTGSVIENLAGKEGFDFTNICEGTVFSKENEYIKEYNEFLKRHGFQKTPLIITVADVCRDDLLFEMDAAFIGK